MKNVEKENKIWYNRKEVNKIYHNRQSIRLKNIQSPTIQLTEIGKIIQDVWNKIPQIYNHAKLHTYVIMPDHMHGIIELCDNFVVNDKGDGRCKKGRTGASAPT